MRLWCCETSRWHKIFFKCVQCLVNVRGFSRSRGSSVVSGYGLDDRAIEVRSPAGARIFSSNLCVQTGSGAHPASCTMGTGGPFPGGKAQPRSDADHSPSCAEVENEELYLLSPQAPPWRVAGLLYLLFTYVAFQYSPDRCIQRATKVSLVFILIK
jgi:hypothetical protein